MQIRLIFIVASDTISSSVAQGIGSLSVAVRSKSHGVVFDQGKLTSLTRVCFFHFRNKIQIN